MKISLKISIYQITRYENDSQFLRSWDRHERTCAGIQYLSCYFGLELFQNCCSLKRNKTINWNLMRSKYHWPNGESVDEVLWQQLIVNDSMLMLCLRKHWGGSYYRCVNDKMWKAKSAGWESAALQWEASAVCVLWDWSWMNLNKWIYVLFPVIWLSGYNEEITQRNRPEHISADFKVYFYSFYPSQEFCWPTFLVSINVPRRLVNSSLVL